MLIKKILIVDDERTIHSYLERKLTKLGYTVHVAEDGETALQSAFQDLPDLILLDVKLPRLDGCEVCRKLKSDARTKTIPVFLLSAKAQKKEIQEGLDAGADKYLCKPMSFPDILKEIQSCEPKTKVPSFGG
jgi:two-component system phosphate regulon response regulator PhoB/two-component system alkaline phosphatase synthesis response regulator PhoP